MASTKRKTSSGIVKLSFRCEVTQRPEADFTGGESFELGGKLPNSGKSSQQPEFNEQGAGEAERTGRPLFRLFSSR